MLNDWLFERGENDMLTGEGRGGEVSSVRMEKVHVYSCADVCEGK